MKNKYIISDVCVRFMCKLVIIVVFTVFGIGNVFAYQEFSASQVAKIAEIKASLSKKYKNKELAPAELKEIDSTLQSFIDFKNHAQAWLKAIDQGKDQALQAKAFVDADMKALAKKTQPPNEFSQHFVKEYSSLKVDDKEGIIKLIEDMAQIIKMFSIKSD